MQFLQKKNQLTLKITLNIFLLLTTLSTPIFAQEKKPLDHTVYDFWNRTHAQNISNDGNWVFVSVGPEEKDSELHVKNLKTDSMRVIPRGATISFSNDSQFIVTLIKALQDSVKQAKRDKKKPEDMPKDSIGILSLNTGELFKAERVKSYKMPKEGSGWIAYLLEKAVPQKDTTQTKDSKKTEEKTSESKKPEPTSEVQPLGEEKKPTETEVKKAEKKDDPKKKKKDKAEGTDLVLRDLQTGREKRFAHVIDYQFSEDGNWLIYTAASKDSTADGIYAIQPTIRDSLAVLTGPGDYKKIAIDEKGTQLAFLTNRDSFLSDQPEYVLYHWKMASPSPKQLATMNTPGIPPTWWVSENGDLSFSKNGKRLFLGTAPKPAPELSDDVPEDEKVHVDVWNWKDPYLQPMQLKDAKKEQTRTYQTVVHLPDNKLVQLATPDIPDIHLGNEGNADVALGITRMPYRQLISWDSPAYYDTYLINIQTGQKTPILTKLQAEPNLSPEANYMFWWDRVQRMWFVQNVKTGVRHSASKNIPYPVHNELHDEPDSPGAHGNAGWTDGDKDFLIYDRYDIWRTDPDGKSPPVNITEGMGRKNDIRFRYVRLDPEERARNAKTDWLLSAFNLTTKAEGFYHDRLEGNREPQQLVIENKNFGNPAKAKNADVFLYTKSSFAECPDLWITDPDFKNPHRMTDINPQQKDYLWGIAELVSWVSLDGAPLQGILCKPENFDPAKKYPMIVFFYEKMSDQLHTYWAPSPGRSVINMSFYTSRGYLVFMPDIPYKIGYPGESAYNAIVPGVTHLIEQGYVDKQRLGIIGHSWSGYQTAYMLTRTNLFRAAEAGATVSNMTSAYGGIRWESGVSRMMQYEKGQSRIGGSLWEYPLRYIENSPIFWADKIQTPLLMMHNDSDGTVPWYQGIELFVALRRLDKPVWMITYNGEDHNLKQYANRKDWTLRLQQFFDHYLKDAPAPVWLEKGIPAVDKGKTLGLELIEKK